VLSGLGIINVLVWGLLGIAMGGIASPQGKREMALDLLHDANYLVSGAVGLFVAYIYWLLYKRPDKNRITRAVQRYRRALYGYVRLVAPSWQPNLDARALLVSIGCFLLGLAAIVLFVLKRLGFPVR
jgi:hypothetical protein